MPIPCHPMVSPLLRPKMIAFHLLCLLAVVAMINLSLWQFHRLDQRRHFNSTVEQRSAAAIVDVVSLGLNRPSAVVDDIEWRRIGAVGTYRPDDQVLVLNRSQGGRAGVDVVTPLQLDDGTSILVVRGFVPLDMPVPAAPAGSVTVVGTARLSDVRRSTDLTAAQGRVRELFRLDIERISQQFDGTLLPIALYSQISEPPDDQTIEPVQGPELTQGPHLSYAIQWLIFSLAVVVGWILAVRRSLRSTPRSLPSA